MLEGLAAQIRNNNYFAMACNAQQAVSPYLYDRLLQAAQSIINRLVYIIVVLLSTNLMPLATLLLLCLRNDAIFHMALMEPVGKDSCLRFIASF
jgi:hypothetical protein